ncbi:hypothetical protein CRM22_010797 [Opisthorchis felineus]|uniref:Dynein light chain n=1 Tax=Opisthorchis felineus TaxID=147828 RepID=A0A4S2KLR0_OPIFE|nr:hypothetical protein CRM22_010797 [Opisthorchis felineus]
MSHSITTEYNSSTGIVTTVKRRMTTDSVDVQITNNDMPEPMQDEIVKQAVDQLDQAQPLNKFPELMKDWLDKKYGPRWHCVLGKNYCSRISFLKGCFLEFVVEGQCILIYRTR